MLMLHVEFPGGVPLSLEVRDCTPIQHVEARGTRRGGQIRETVSELEKRNPDLTPLIPFS